MGSGGSAKTDIICKLSYNNEIKTFTFSIKNTTRTQVSCHETAKDFLNVLNINRNDSLAKYIIKFQEHGGYNKLINDNFSIHDFHKVYSPYRKKFAEWVLKGQHEIQDILNVKNR